MNDSPLRAMAPLALTILLLGFPLTATTAAPRYKTNLPPSAELSYAIKAKQKGIAVDGDAVMRWNTASGKFTASNEARAMLVGKILDAKTEGDIGPFGLAPLNFTEKRFRKEATTTSFDRSAGIIRFTASEQTYPIKGGEQDRNSVVWQLATIARSTPNKFKAGASIPLTVVGQKDADAWTFKVGKAEKIKTSTGDLNTVKVSRVIKDGGKDQKLDIWFAPSMEWYPARVRITEPEGDFIEQTLTKVDPV